VVLSFVHAYRGRDLLHNLFGLQSGELAYVAAGLVVLADFGIEGAPVQRHFTAHNADVSVNTLHPLNS